MASASLENELSFVAEIDPLELEKVKVVGKGSFGVVSKGRWNGKDVAIKYIETDEEKKAFRVEVRQLSRVTHPNIVKLYGACTAGPVCLVMEFAEGGSLFNVLHGKPPQPIYTCAHALSWAYQCSLGVAFLHNMKPKALIHRDLKPANLLLMEGGTVLKICDFGTACDIQTYMTNSKGSAAWMAPEVFEGQQYNEKCDIFSWGVILWEVLSRKRPFENIDGPAFAIMWAIHEGKRPARIRNLPRPLSELLNRCWSREPGARPSMDEVLRIITQLKNLVKGADVPLVYPNAVPEAEKLTPIPSYLPTSESTHGGSTHSTVSDTVMPSGENITKLSDGSETRQDSGESEGSSGVKLRVKNKDQDLLKRRSADILEIEKTRFEENTAPKPAGQSHRRSNSHGQIIPSDIPPQPKPHQPVHLSQSMDALTFQHQFNFEPTPPKHASTVPSDLHMLEQVSVVHPPPPPHLSSPPPKVIVEDYYPKDNVTTQDSPCRGTRPKSSSELESCRYSSLTEFRKESSLANQTVRSISVDPGEQHFGDCSTIPEHKNPDEDQILSILTSELEPALQPLPPDRRSEESIQIYQAHCKMVGDLLKLQTERALLNNRKRELQNELSDDWKSQQDSFKLIEQYNILKREKEKLMKRGNELRSELNIIKAHRSYTRD